jgi:hypothetical protein
MTMSLTPIDRHDFASDQDKALVSGLRDYAILAQMKKVPPEMASRGEDRGRLRHRLQPVSVLRQFIWISPIHGAPAIASGVKTANPDLRSGS